MVKMKYIIMCGGDYVKWETPRQLVKIEGEELVARTIRLLREAGVTDINISSNNPIFEKFNIPVLKHDNLYIANGIGNVIGDWFNAFFPTDEPTCYIFGDVFFSPEAIKKIVETEVDDIELFGSQPPFDKRYFKTHIEPFALKVMNTKHLKEAIEKTREYDKEHKFWRKPIVWELFTIIKDAPLQTKLDEYTTDYVAINDYTCDIDKEEDIMEIKRRIGDIEMIKCEVIERFTLGRFNELKNIKRKSVDTNGELYVGDVFECEKELADYLMGNNSKKKVVVKVIEVIPEAVFEQPKKEEVKEVKKPSVKTTKKSKKRK